MQDFRGNHIAVGDVVIYVGGQDMKAFLIEAEVLEVKSDKHLVVKPLRSSNPMGHPTGRPVHLKVDRKVVKVPHDHRVAV